ncbi:MAG TPA: ABC transporter ATP-binding protein, partial [Acidimicrobiales bacterium]|nr:ABC transporter ATP-binding protein [Acidimicrobiales bacterium]
MTPAAAGAAAATTGVDEARPPALELAGVRAGYGRIEVIHGVDLAVPEGSVFALLGPNGAGKSTLLKVAGGRVAARAGSVSVGGQPIGRHEGPDRLARRGVCSIPEGRGVFPNLTVRENLWMWTYQGDRKPKAVEERAFARFPRLADRRKQLAGTLSGGEQQMLALARALVGEPTVLLLDELSMGLAPLVVSQLYEAVAGLRAEGVTVVLSEQFVRTALAIATHAAIVAAGRIDRVGAPAEVAEVALETYLAGPD